MKGKNWKLLDNQIAAQMAPVRSAVERLLRQQNVDALLGIGRSPDAIGTPHAPFVAGGLDAATRRFRQDNLQVSLLRAQPGADEIDRVRLHGCHELVPCLVLDEGVDESDDLLVALGYLFEHVMEGRVVIELGHVDAQGTVHGDEHIVDGGLGVLVELLVDSYRVGKLDRRKGLQVRCDVVGKVRDEARLLATA